MILNEPIIEVRNLQKYYGENQILKGIDFTAEKGNLISLIGRSGCGKTTFLRCLNCLEILDIGVIKIAGISLSRTAEDINSLKKISAKALKVRTNVSMPFQGYENVSSIDEDFQIKAHALRARVGMLFQSFNLFPHMSVLENVTIALIKVNKEPKDLAEHIAISMLEKVGMDTFMDRKPYQLSGGQAQRVAIARALALRPQVMLYDEPTSALDPELVDEVTDVMLQLKDEGMTQIVVTHSMHFAKKASSYIVYMHEGQVVEIAPPLEIFESPKDKRTKAYLKIFHD